MANPSRRTSHRRRGGIQWGSFGAGLMFGIALTLTGALLPELLEEDPATAAATPAPASATTPRFEFFDSLPKGRVSVNTKPYETLTPNTAGAEAMEYLLQVGSFSSREDAERLRASVLLTGLEAHTTEATLPSGVLKHRVIVGPYRREPDMRRAMTKLREQNINPLLLARKPGTG